MRLTWYYCLRNLKKLGFRGLLQNYMGVFGKILHSFQNRFTWQLFCSMLFKHSNGNNDEDFRNVLTFIFFQEKRNGFSERSLIFLKTDKIVTFVPEGVSNSALNKNSQNEEVQNLGFLRWQMAFFEKKKLFFFSQPLHLD